MVRPSAEDAPDEGRVPEIVDRPPLDVPTELEIVCSVEEDESSAGGV